MVQPCIFYAHSQVHDPITLYLLPWGRYEEAVQTNNISRPPEQKLNFFSPSSKIVQQLPLPTSQARAGGSWQFKQVVVVDVAVVVVLVVVVVDLHLIHLV